MKEEKAQLSIYVTKSFYDLFQIVKPFVSTKTMALNCIEELKEDKTLFLSEMKKRVLAKNQIINGKEVILIDADSTKSQRIILAMADDFRTEWDLLLEEIRKIEKIGRLSNQYISLKIIEHQIDKAIQTIPELLEMIKEIVDLQLKIANIDTSLFNKGKDNE